MCLVPREEAAEAGLWSDLKANEAGEISVVEQIHDRPYCRLWLPLLRYETIGGLCSEG